MNNKEVARYEAGKHYKNITQPCALCGAVNTVKHHEDYNEPLNVIWLCKTCHGQYHTNTLRQIHIEHIKTMYRWFYIKKWVTYQWYVDNKAVYFKRGLKELLPTIDNTFNASIEEAANTFNDPPETLIY